MHTQKVEKLSFRRLDWNIGEHAQFGVDKMRQLCTYSKCVHAECSACLRKRLGLFLITFLSARSVDPSRCRRCKSGASEGARTGQKLLPPNRRRGEATPREIKRRRRRKGKTAPLITNVAITRTKMTAKRQRVSKCERPTDPKRRMIPLMSLINSGKTWQEKMLKSDRRMIRFHNTAGL